MNTSELIVGEHMQWDAWLDLVTPTAKKLITDLNKRAIPVSVLRERFKNSEIRQPLPPDLPGVYGFFTANPKDINPLVKFGESYELFARLVSHIGVKPNKNVVPQRYREEGNKFSGDSSFRVKIARALGLIIDGEYKKTELRGEKSEISIRINNAIDKYRVAWQPLLFGRAELQTWVEWTNHPSKTYRARQMKANPFQARLKPTFDKSLFSKEQDYWKKTLDLT